MRFRLRFSLRFLMLFVFALAVMLVYVWYRLDEANRESLFVEELEKRGGWIRNTPQEYDPTWIKWIDKVAGPYLLGDVVMAFLDNTSISDNDLEFLTMAPNLSYVYLESTAITDRGLNYLCRNIPNLKFIAVTATNVTEEGVNQVRRDYPSLGISSSFRHPNYKGE